MVYIKWLIRIVVFILLLGFAIKNIEPVTLHYFLDYHWQEPLVVFLLVFFVLGVIVGLLVAMGSLFRQRRELQKLRRELHRIEKNQTHDHHIKPIQDISTAAHIDAV